MKSPQQLKQEKMATHKLKDVMNRIKKNNPVRNRAYAIPTPEQTKPRTKFWDKTTAHYRKKMLKAQMYFLTTAQGGRTQDFIPDPSRKNAFWANTWDKNKNAWSVGLTFEAGTVVMPGSTHIVDVAFFVSEAYTYFVSGDDLNFYEGNRIVAKGKIL